jgi:hypothetical protein
MMTDEVQRLKLALAALTDAFLERHGCFPLDNAGWKAAMADAYGLIGQPNTIGRSAALNGDTLASEPAAIVPLATLNAIHTELACGMAFLGRGPGGTNSDHIAKWAELCSQVADGLAKADALVRPIIHPT